MKHQFPDERHVHMLRHLSSLPKKILSLYGQDNITEFVLHDLCDARCFNLQKAAYFVNNHDFNCLKGVTGFCQNEAYSVDNIWHNPHNFSKHMQNADFNKQVRLFEEKSCKKDNDLIAHNTLQNIAKKLSFERPQIYSWDMKHDNKGILIYQKMDEQDDHKESDILNGLSLLSFCPIF